MGKLLADQTALRPAGQSRLLTGRTCTKISIPHTAAHAKPKTQRIKIKKYKKTRTYQLDGFNISSNSEVSYKKLRWFAHRRNYINKVLRKISPIAYLHIVNKVYNSLVWYLETYIKDGLEYILISEEQTVTYVITGGVDGTLFALWTEGENPFIKLISQYNITT